MGLAGGGQVFICLLQLILVKAGCVTELADANLSPEFALEALKYSPFMRRRITLLRILPLLGIEEDMLKL